MKVLRPLLLQQLRYPLLRLLQPEAATFVPLPPGDVSIPRDRTTLLRFVRTLAHALGCAVVAVRSLVEDIHYDSMSADAGRDALKTAMQNVREIDTDAVFSTMRDCYDQERLHMLVAGSDSNMKVALSTQASTGSPEQLKLLVQRDAKKWQESMSHGGFNWAKYLDLGVFQSADGADRNVFLLKFSEATVFFDLHEQAVYLHASNHYFLIKVRQYEHSRQQQGQEHQQQQQEQQEQLQRGWILRHSYERCNHW